MVNITLNRLPYACRKYTYYIGWVVKENKFMCTLQSLMLLLSSINRNLWLKATYDKISICSQRPTGFFKLQSSLFVYTGIHVYISIYFTAFSKLLYNNYFLIKLTLSFENTSENIKKIYYMKEYIKYLISKSVHKSREIVIIE